MFTPRHLFVLGASILLTVSGAMAATLTVGQSTGHTYDGPDGVVRAVGAAHSGDTINIQDAGVYDPVVVPGGDHLTITGATAGVVLQGSRQPGVYADATTGTITLTLNNLKIENTLTTSSTNLSSALYAQQGSTDSQLNLTINNCFIVQSDVSGTAVGGHGVYLNHSAGLGTTTTLTMTDTDVQSLWANNSSYHALNVYTDGSAPVAINLTSCSLLSNSGQGAAFRGDYQTWNLNKCRVEATLVSSSRSVFRGGNSNYCTYNLTDSDFVGPGEVIMDYNSGGSGWTENHFIVTRCTIDNRIGTGNKQGVYLRFNGGIAGTNTAEFYNCVFLGTGAESIYTRGAEIPVKCYNCTFLHTSANSSYGVRIYDVGSPTLNEVYNCIFDNVGNPVATGTVVGGDLIACADGRDDTDLGSDRIRTTDTLLNLDANQVPQAGSPAIDAGLNTPSILAAIGYVDRNDTFRGNRGGIDIGAFETNPQTVNPITVSLGGVAADVEGVGGIDAASLGCINNGDVEVIEGGTYNGFTVHGGKTYRIRGMVPGVVTGAVGSEDANGTYNILLGNMTINGGITDDSPNYPDFQKWQFLSCIVNNTNGIGFNVNDEHSSATMVVQDSKIYSSSEGIKDDHEDHVTSGNSWLINRCIVDNSQASTPGGPAHTRPVRISYMDLPTGVIAAPNTIDVFNTLVVCQEGSSGSDSNSRSLYFVNGNVKARVYYCTLAAVGHIGGRGIYSSFTGTGNNVDVYNTLFLNFSDPFAGQQGSKSKNYIIGPADESSSFRAGGTFTSNTGGLASCMAAAGLNASYIPQAGSLAIGVADDSVLATTGQLDQRGGIRPDAPAATDVGAYEATLVPVTLSTFHIE